MNGTGLKFTSPGVIRIEKVFSPATVPNFSWAKVSNVFSSQNVLIYLPLLGPAIIPFLVVIHCDDVDMSDSSTFSISYFSGTTILENLIIANTLGRQGTTTTVHAITNDQMQNNNWSSSIEPMGLCISTDSGSGLGSGVSLTITLYCVNSGLNYQ